jgi:hypothetical protein
MAMTQCPQEIFGIEIVSFDMVTFLLNFDWGRFSRPVVFNWLQTNPSNYLRYFLRKQLAAASFEFAPTPLLNSGMQAQAAPTSSLLAHYTYPDFFMKSCP